jgi:hypothetical protein
MVGRNPLDPVNGHIPHWDLPSMATLTVAIPSPANSRLLVWLLVTPACLTWGYPVEVAGTRSGVQAWQETLPETKSWWIPCFGLQTWLIIKSCSHEVAKHKSGVICQFHLTVPHLATTLRKMVSSILCFADDNIHVWLSINVAPPLGDFGYDAEVGLRAKLKAILCYLLFSSSTSSALSLPGSFCQRKLLRIHRGLLPLAEATYLPRFYWHLHCTNSSRHALSAMKNPGVKSV